MKHSCGAILYTRSPAGVFGIILGLEGNSWFPFKGCKQDNETFEETAIREIYEETCGVVKASSISLKHHFKTNHKYYHIGLYEVPYNIIPKFFRAIKNEKRKAFLEKKSIKFFPINVVHNIENIHSITLSSINFYRNELDHLEKYCTSKYNNDNMRKHSVLVQFAEEQYQKLNHISSLDKITIRKHTPPMGKKYITYSHSVEQINNYLNNHTNNHTNNKPFIENKFTETKYNQYLYNLKDKSKLTNNQSNKLLKRCTCISCLLNMPKITSPKYESCSLSAKKWHNEHIQTNSFIHDDYYLKKIKSSQRAN